MRVAVIADVHGNRLALAAVLESVAAARPDLLIELGDAVSGPLWPAETYEMLAATGAVSVRGNHDRWVAEGAPETLGTTDRFTQARLSAAQRAALGARPMTWRGEGILGMHSLPDDDLTYVMHESTRHGIRERVPGEVEVLLPKPAGESLVLTAHTHRAHAMQLRDGRLVVNPGSVGQPAYTDTTPFPHVMQAGSPHARWALLERRGSAWRVNFHAIEYDWDAAASEAARHGRDDWSRALATGNLS
ncbi:metallophosphoesterase family protein [Sediminicoccus rosea]|jgi:putative phosphoesterase|uniref:Metallophosphoesterase family protein n=1 Tax=Sediminicoccus rosea TaxID=1225128 RepID=A0ABZ0PGD3_9PROT|nr:metallophosphoesterase family protein [Sediminicoccus rosea]WPB84536.1 metallophosphoesterase family protein [Sediminicoccus rosea]